MKEAIAAGHDLTADTALQILKDGGNAFDAAIAAYLVSFVAEPCMASAGGGAFAQVMTADGTIKVFDFFCQTPIVKRNVDELQFYPIDVDFGEAIETFHIGRGACAVPGAIAGVYAMHKNLGSMPMKDLVEPAILAAKNGVIINDFQHFDLVLLEKIFRESEKGKELFFKDDKVLQVGDTLKMPAMADFLDYMSREGEAAFYQGEVAEKIVRDFKDNGGQLSLDDFKNYEVVIRDPLQFNYNGKSIYTNPAPSTGGSIIALLLNFIDATPADQHPWDFGHMNQVRKMLEKFTTVGTKPASIASQLAKFNIFDKYNLHETNRRGSTSHFNIVDRKGNAVALTTTIGEGCGHFVEGTDIHMNNMLGEAALLPNGFHSWEENVRLSSMMSPTLVLDEHNRLETVLGSGGASRIPTMIAQVLHYLIDYKMELNEAIAAPRMHMEHGKLDVEGGFKNQFNQKNFPYEINHWKGSSLFFGGVHTLNRRKNEWLAVGDQRRDGVAR